MDILHEDGEFNGPPDETALAFWRDHCGTSKKHVLLVTAVFPPCECGFDDCENNEDAAISNVFSSYDEAEEWLVTLDPEIAVVVMPMVIDNPMFGSEAVN